MGSAKLNDWLQIIGMAGIMASLIFVGIQVQQTERAGKGQEVAAFMENVLALRALQTENAAVWRKVCAGKELTVSGQSSARPLWTKTKEAWPFTGQYRPGWQSSTGLTLIRIMT